MVTKLFGWMAIGLVPAVIKLLFDRVLFVLKKSVFYCLYSWVLLLVKLAVNYVAMHFYGLEGIVASTVILNCLCIVFFYLYLKYCAKPEMD